MRQQFLVEAEAVMAHYPVRVEDIHLVQGEAKKAIWRVSTPPGVFALKRHARPISRVLFSLDAQEYLASHGGRVPGLLRARDGQPLVEREGKAFSLSTWIPGQSINPSSREGLELAMEGLGCFHRASEGFRPSPGNLESSKLGRWPSQYKVMRRRLLDWREAAANRDGAIGEVYLSLVGQVLDAAEEALDLLENSHYSTWVEKVRDTGSLCHQDYGEGNAISGDGGVWVLDLDDVTLDLPVRDLRKIINKVIGRQGVWDHDLFQWMMRAYEREHPLTEPQRRVLLIDLLFPHAFHDTAKNPFKKGKVVAPSKLQDAARFEGSKTTVRSMLLAGLGSESTWG